MSVSLCTQAQTNQLYQLLFHLVLQERDLLQARLHAATSPRTVAAMRATIKAEEEARAVAHQVAVRAVAAACAREEARLAALPVHPIAAPATDNQVHWDCGVMTCCLDPCGLPVHLVIAPVTDNQVLPWPENL